MSQDKVVKGEGGAATHAPDVPSIRDENSPNEVAEFAFDRRHIGPGEEEHAVMLKELGFSSATELLEAAAPSSIIDSEKLGLPAALTEHEALTRLKELAAKNTVRRSFIGLGYYGTITPSVIRRNVLENPSWYTAYTPYQPEISQGRLEALLSFQTMISDLTGLDVTGASLLDEGTAAAEAMSLMHRANRKAPKDAKLLIDADVLPHTLAVIRTRADAIGFGFEIADLSDGLPEGDFFGVLLQYPGASGEVRDLEGVITEAKDRKIMVTVAADLLALTLLKSPGEMGADIAVGTSQRFGVSLGFGGPHAGYMSVEKGLERQLPGRLVGVSQDADGATAYRLALQTREQHIRREKATSNICTAQVLLAVMASMYGVYHGPDGLKAIARQVHERATSLAASLKSAGSDIVHDSYFDTVLVKVPGKAEQITKEAYDKGYLIRQVDADHVSLSCDEMTSEGDIARLVKIFGASDVAAGDNALPQQLQRTSEFMTHAVFNSYHSETLMMRYLKKLADYDFALDRGMIPLGSCTMKLNAATEMEAVTWPEFAGLHPFAPQEDTVGTRELISELEDYLCTITGYDGMSLQPNAGAQGEFAGLMAIRAYHVANGDDQRDICLIPTSAHGTNAASAVMAGLKAVSVKSAENGNVDMDDLDAKIEKYGDKLAAIMVTYPSTHGVYEPGIKDLCAKVHEAGGQVYVDGANMNALVGLARPGKFGSDVSHLNLHKTFCIPHGGGGPGVGPIGVREHLIPFMPSNDVYNDVEEVESFDKVGPVASAPYGSAGILQITWAYISMMGPEGLRKATENAVTNANYIAKRLSEHYPVLYSNENGLVAHECILDLRPLKDETGITVDDVAKRLIDYGFHAPTMSFPVAGTLMVEPTESEDLGEIDRFIDAMIAIKKEADKVAAGDWPAEDNPLVNAPHTAHMLIGEWEHPYTREEGVLPGGMIAKHKYWPPVRRIDGAWGDRNLMCACPPMDELVEE